MGSKVLREGEPGTSSLSRTDHLSRQWLCFSMFLLGCLCHGLLKMNAQDEQPWREIHAKAITVSFCKAQKIRVIIKFKV